jgi:multiple sugar transport system permease protein
MANAIQIIRTFVQRLIRQVGGLVHFEVSDRTLAVFLILPAVLLVLVFAIFPMLQGLYASFFQIEAATLDMQFNNIENYRWLLTQSLFWSSLLRSILWVTGTTVTQIILGMGISLLVHQELKGRNLARGLVLFPYLIPAVVIALTWRFILDPTMGVLNRMLMDLGLARLQVVPVELEEAARIDGAGEWHVFRHITLPWLMPVLIVTALLRTIWTFRQFDIVYLFSSGGPLFATTTLPVLVRHLAFDAQQIGPAAATASVMVILLLLMSWGYFALYGRAEEELS